MRTVLLPKDYVRLAMTGDKASDMSDSAGTLWLDVAARDWSDAMLAATGLTPRGTCRACMKAARPPAPCAPMLPRAGAWAACRSPPAAGDNAAGAAGVGVVDDGDALLSLGTSGVIFVATEGIPAQSGARGPCLLPLPARPVAPDERPPFGRKLHRLGGAADRAWTCPAFFAAAEAAGAAAGPELFLPYLSGERTPHNDPHVRGAFLGLDNESDPGRIAAAVLEGVAFAHADGLAALREAGTRVENLSVIGGGARSRYWGTILAAALDVRLAYLDGGEVGPALGAAKLAQMAVTGASAAEVCTRPPVAQIIEPDPALADRLAPRLAKFRRAYAAIASI